MARLAVRPHKKIKKTMVDGIAHIRTPLNNTIATITDRRGNALSWAASNGSGFRSSHKNIPFATQVAVERVGQAALEYGLKDLNVNVKGPGLDRGSAVCALNVCGYKVASITDITSIPRNGCRSSKKRHV